MPIDRDALMSAVVTGEPVNYREKDVMLYALGIGFGRDPVNDAELEFVLENRGPKTVPTLASMLVPDRILTGSDIAFSHLLHRAQSMVLHRPLPASADLLADQRIVSLCDRGRGLGAEITMATELRRVRDETVICTLETVVIARADGGFGGPAPPPRNRLRMPDRAPDFITELETRPDQALLFRLSGDMNPLHADPAVARGAGFEKPILHGRCTYGIACKAILETVCEYDHTLIREFGVRFSAPVYPGDVIATEMWQNGDTVFFRSRVAGRNVTVLGEGHCILRG